MTARFSSSDFSDNPELKKIKPTAKYLTVISGCKGPPFKDFKIMVS